MIRIRSDRLALWGSLFTLVFILAGCNSTSTRHTPTAPRRIISLVPAATEMLFAIGAGPDVIGVSSYDTFPPEAATRPKLGALVDPDFERILSMKPDLVVVYGTQSDLVGKLQRAGVAYFGFEHAGLADITATIRSLGERIGRANDAARVADAIEADLDRVRASVAGRPRPRTALIFGRDPGSLRGMYASAGVGFLHDILLVAGGDDAFGDVMRQSLQLSTETLLARAPDAIVEIRPAEGWNAARIADERGVWNALPSIPAVRTRRIYLLADDRLSIPGPRVAQAARLIAGVLHPDVAQPTTR